MKPIGGPQKLRFTIQSCSGEVGTSAGEPASQLAAASHAHVLLCRIRITRRGSCCTIAPQRGDGTRPGGGRCSALSMHIPFPGPAGSIAGHLHHTPFPGLCRFCKYPQEIVLRLEKPSKITQLQILAHEFKVGGRRSRGCAAGCWSCTWLRALQQRMHPWGRGMATRRVQLGQRQGCPAHAAGAAVQQACAALHALQNACVHLRMSPSTAPSALTQHGGALRPWSLCPLLIDPHKGGGVCGHGQRERRRAQRGGRPQAAGVPVL